MAKVKWCIPGPFQINVIDATINRKGFEHDMTLRLCQRLAAASLPLARNAPAFPKTVEELEIAFQAKSNIVLYIAHGGKPIPQKSTLVQGGEIDTNWHFLSRLNIDLINKLVCLGVCWGLSSDVGEPDALELIHGPQLALAMIGPEKELYADEIEAFYPDFYERLFAVGDGPIDPIFIRKILGEIGLMPNNKIKMFG